MTPHGRKQIAGQRPRDNEGVALIIALVVIVLLSVLVVEFGYESQINASFAMNQSADFEAYLAAKSAVAKGIGLLRADLIPDPEAGANELFDTTQVDSALDPWALPGTPEPLNQATMRTSISDEFGKINLNAMFEIPDGGGQPEIRQELADALYAFFVMRNAEGDNPTDAILDWLDYDDDDQERDEGAESSFYEEAEIPYACKNGPMDSIEELLLIKGITPEIYFGDPDADPPQLPLSEYLTVNGDWQGRVNGNTALPEVLAAMKAGFEGNREGPELDPALEAYDLAHNETPFLDAAAISNAMGIAEPKQRDGNGRNINRQNPQDPNDPNDPNNPNTGTQAEQMWRVTSDVFRIHGDGMQGDIMVRVEAFVYRTPLDFGQEPPTVNGQPVEPPAEPFRIISWNVIR